jgi:hypothetical protein
MDNSKLYFKFILKKKGLKVVKMKMIEKEKTYKKMIEKEKTYKKMIEKYGNILSKYTIFDVVLK